MFTVVHHHHHYNDQHEHVDQDQAGVRGAGDGKDGSGRLVPPLSPWTEH